jgi:hypothetical protein
MAYAERQVADGVVAMARQIAGALPVGRWWLWPDGRTAAITQTDPMWVRMLSAQRYVVWLDDA